jgi:SAM-dependent methyltransferase
MKKESILQAVYNDGERLVPGETHDRAEIVRHKSSYAFFRRIIEADILDNPELLAKPISILDIGSGTGHGTFMLHDILNTRIIGIDPGTEAVAYAQQIYVADNIEYINIDVESYIKQAPSFDYVVSRHALEHVDNGLELALKFKASRRLVVNVPFNENDSNIHHKLHWITEASFDEYTNKEFFYEGLDGVTRNKRDEIMPPNSIICISSADKIKSVHGLFNFPLASWQPEYLQEIGITAFGQLDGELNGRQGILDEHEAALKQRDEVLNGRQRILDAHEAALKQRDEVHARLGKSS